MSTPKFFDIKYYSPTACTNHTEVTNCPAVIKIAQITNGAGRIHSKNCSSIPELKDKYGNSLKLFKHSVTYWVKNKSAGSFSSSASRYSKHVKLPSIAEGDE